MEVMRMLAIMISLLILKVILHQNERGVKPLFLEKNVLSSLSLAEFLNSVLGDNLMALTKSRNALGDVSTSSVQKKREFQNRQTKLVALQGFQNLSVASHFVFSVADVPNIPTTNPHVQSYFCISAMQFCIATASGGNDVFLLVFDHCKICPTQEHCSEFVLLVPSMNRFL